MRHATLVGLCIESQFWLLIICQYFLSLVRSCVKNYHIAEAGVTLTRPAPKNCHLVLIYRSDSWLIPRLQYVNGHADQLPSLHLLVFLDAKSLNRVKTHCAVTYSTTECVD